MEQNKQDKLLELSLNVKLTPAHHLYKEWECMKSISNIFQDTCMMCKNFNIFIKQRRKNSHISIFRISSISSA